MDKKASIFTDDEPKKEKIKKKKEAYKPSEDFVPRRSSRARHSTGTMDDDEDLKSLDELEEKPREVVYTGGGGERGREGGSRRRKRGTNTWTEEEAQRHRCETCVGPYL